MTARAKLRRLDVATMIESPPPPVPWLVEGLVVKGALTLLAGLPGQGKSLLAQALAMAATRPGGGSCAGINVKAGHVLIIDAENGEREIHRRVHALGLVAEHAQRLEVVEAEGFHLRDDLGQLEELLRAVRPDLLILDGFRSLWPVGDENKSDDVAPVLDALRNLIRRSGCGAILIHHTGKSGQTYRGSSAIGGAAEIVFVLDTADGDDDPHRRRLRCEKCRPAPKPAPRWLRLATESDLSRGLAPIDHADPFLAGGERAPQTASRAVDVVTVLRSRGRLTRPEIARELGFPPSDGTLRRAVERAETEGSITRLADNRFEACQP